jgi:sec-independent protein translocase protein TatA
VEIQDRVPLLDADSRATLKSLGKERIMFGLGTQELLVILVIALVLFGANRLPQIARSLGSSLKEFKKGIDEGKREDNGGVTPSADRSGSAITPQSCASCKSPLAADWTHCPRCGTTVTQSSPTSPPRA